MTQLMQKAKEPCGTQCGGTELKKRLLVNLFEHITSRRRFHFALLVILTIISSFAEIFSLGSIVPFIAILTQPEKIYSYPFISEFSTYLGARNANDLIAPIAWIFIIAAIFAGMSRVIILYLSIRLGNSIGADLSVEMYRRTLYQAYTTHITRSSSELISGITQKVTTTTSILTSLVSIATSSIIFSIIFLTLIIIYPEIAALTFASFGAVYLLITITTKRRIRFNSDIVASQQTYVVKALQEGLGAIRDILLDRTQPLYVSIFNGSIQALQRATGENLFITLAPRYIMEALALVLIGLFSIIVSNPGQLNSSLPALAALALGAQRLLPLLQQLYANTAFIKGSQSALQDVLLILNQPIQGYIVDQNSESINFSKQIEFKDVRFSYTPQGPIILDNFNLCIKKGSVIGIVGTTGSGKSTVTDLLMCLLLPTSGQILIDSEPLTFDNISAWQKILSHVPQNIYLTDDSILKNIAFGIPFNQINIEKVKYAARKAQLYDFVTNLHDGFDTIVGERGVRLSGGQRQRIGIARALYKDAAVLIFDEATSALDTETENAVMESISNLGDELTIILVAHRISTLTRCDQILELSRAGHAARWTYKEYCTNLQK
jgi:ABC-type multidrug transport system fused ATPase/permease subunit